MRGSSRICALPQQPGMAVSPPAQRPSKLDVAGSTPVARSTNYLVKFQVHRLHFASPPLSTQPGQLRLWQIDFEKMCDVIRHRTSAMERDERNGEMCQVCTSDRGRIVALQTIPMINMTTPAMPKACHQGNH